MREISYAELLGQPSGVLFSYHDYDIDFFGITKGFTLGGACLNYTDLMNPSESKNNFTSDYPDMAVVTVFEPEDVARLIAELAAVVAPAFPKD
jgi:hypothetical protein